MKAIIPCAGEGSRLRPLTFTKPKPVIPIANKPLLVYAIEAIKQVGIEEIGLVVSDNSEGIKRVLGDGSDYGVNLTYIVQDEPLGIAHTIKVSQDFLGDDTFLMYLGDNLLQEGLEEPLRRFQQNQPNSLIFLSETDKPHLYGIAIIENDRVTKLIEKPKDSPSNLAAIGVYIFDSNVHEVIKNQQPSARGELEITDAIQGLIDRGKEVDHHTISGWWVDAGNPRDMIETNRLVLDELTPNMEGACDEESQLSGKVTVGQGTIIENSIIHGPTIIGNDCTIRNAFIGSYTSIGDETCIEDSEVGYSVIMEQSRIEGVEIRIENSIIGDEVTIERPQHRPHSYQLVLADKSLCELM